MGSDWQERWVFEQKYITGLAGADNGLIFMIAGRYGCEERPADQFCGNKLAAIDQSAVQAWEYNLSTIFIGLKPVVSGDKVYVLDNCLGHTGFGLFSFDFDGNLNWVFDTEASPESALYSQPDFSCGPGGLSSGAHISSPVIGIDGTVYFGDQKNLYAISPAGNLKWKTDFNTNQISAPSIDADGIIYVVTDRLLAINPQDGTVAWVSQTLKASFGPAISQNGLLYASGWASGSGRLYSINPADGLINLNFSPTQSGVTWSWVSAPLLGSNYVFLATGHIIRAFDLQDSDEVWGFASTAGNNVPYLVMANNGAILVPGQKLIAIFASNE